VAREIRCAEFPFRLRIAAASSAVPQTLARREHRKNHDVAARNLFLFGLIVCEKCRNDRNSCNGDNKKRLPGNPPGPI
jgi:hypothetical protein